MRKQIVRKIVVMVDGVDGWAVDREIGPLEDANLVLAAEYAAAKMEFPRRIVLATLLIDEFSA